MAHEIKIPGQEFITDFSSWKTDPVTLRTAIARHQAKIMKEYGLRAASHSSKCMRAPMTVEHRRALNLCSHSPERVEEAEQVIAEQVQQFQEWARDEFPVGKKFEIVVRYDWARNRTRSRGGSYSARYRSWERPNSGLRSGPMISMAMGRHVPMDPAEDQLYRSFVEYSHIAKDPEIGTFQGVWQDCVRVLTIHECAHAVQFNASWSKHPWKKDFPREEHRAHKALWQHIYRKGRQQFGLAHSGKPA